ncbi:PAS domain-containing protein [Rhizobium deserti]|nr:PAS domain-containing protein [Rhizobium deserti]
MQNQASRQVFDYWIQLRGSRPAPLRTEIDPVALRRILPHLFIAESGPQETLSFRLAGTRICDLFDREFRGSSFGAIWTDGESSRSLEIVQNVIHYEQPALLQVNVAKDEEAYHYEMLLLPVRSGGSHSDRVLGALLPQQEPVPDTAFPAVGLALESWTLLGSDSGEPQMDGAGGDDGPFSRFWRSLPATFVSHNRLP